MPKLNALQHLARVKRQHARDEEFAAAPTEAACHQLLAKWAFEDAKEEAALEHAQSLVGRELAAQAKQLAVQAREIKALKAQLKSMEQSIVKA
jgi:hypothetical protein